MAVALFVAIVAVAAALLSTKFAAIRQFDTDPSCAIASPGLPSTAVAGICERKPIRITRTWTSSVGRSGTTRFVEFTDENSVIDTAQIVPADSVFVQMLYPGEATVAVYYRQHPVRIAWRQYWLATEDDPHRAVFKTELIVAIVIVLYAIIARTIYLQGAR